MKKYKYNVFILGDYCVGYVYAKGYIEALGLAEAKEKKIYNLEEA